MSGSASGSASVEASVEAKGFVLRRNWPLLGATALVFVAALMIAWVSAVHAPAAYGVAFLCATMGVVFGLRNAAPRRVATRIRATPTGLTIESQGMNDEGLRTRVRITAEGCALTRSYFGDTGHMGRDVDAIGKLCGLDAPHED